MVSILAFPYGCIKNYRRKYPEKAWTNYKNNRLSMPSFIMSLCEIMMTLF